MNAKKWQFAVIIILQAIIIGLLCYASFIATRPNVCLLVCAGISQPAPEVPENGDDYGLRTEDAERIVGGQLERRTKMACVYITNSMKERAVAMELDKLPDQLYSELQRYQSMSDKEKQEFEKKLSKEIMKSEELNDLLKKIGQTMRRVAQDH